jgi:hypothetical protein
VNSGKGNLQEREIGRTDMPGTLGTDIQKQPIGLQNKLIFFVSRSIKEVLRFYLMIGCTTHKNIHDRMPLMIEGYI